MTDCLTDQVNPMKQYPDVCSHLELKRPYLNEKPIKMNETTLTTFPIERPIKHKLNQKERHEIAKDMKDQS
jgi:hypothetical protein